jgi:hypothetical protein
MRRELALATVAIVSVSEVRAGDNPPGDYYGQLAATVKAKLDALVSSHAPKPVPPVPIKPAWKAVKVGSIDLGAPLVAFAAAELDGDPKAAELYALTPREVIALGYKGGKLVELSRVPFTGDRAVPEPRDVVGTIVVDNGEIVAAASPWAKELRLKWSGKALVGQLGTPGFLLCPGVRAQLQHGRNHFTTGTFETRCREDLVDATGNPLRVRADLATTGRLTVVVEKCVAGKCETERFEYPNVGIAFAVADVDRDGTPEIVVSEASAPGATDSAKVHTLGGDDKKPVFRRTFNGGVAGLVVADGDDADDIAEVIAAVRLPGSTRVDVWRLD